MSGEQAFEANALARWNDEQDRIEDDQEYYEAEEPCDRGDLRDDGRSFGYGESYAERNA